MDLTTREKISNSKKGKRLTAEHKANLSKAWKNRKKVAPLLERDIKEMKEEKEFNDKIKHLPQTTLL